MYGMHWSLVGGLIVAAAFADALWTTLTVNGAGWLSSSLAGRAGQAAMRGPAWIAENASVLALCLSFLMWCLLLWSG